MWNFSPAGCQYRNGLAESRVKALKHSLEHVMIGGGENLNYTEFRSFLLKCVNIINDRPLGVLHHGGATDVLMPLTPNHLLLGRTSTSATDAVEFTDEDSDKFTKRAAFVNELERAWWNMWLTQCFSSLLPFPKWTERSRNLRPGDICVIKYDNQVRKADYRLCRVNQTYPDEKGLVRTVDVEMRPRDSRDKSLPYVPKTLKVLKTGVNRLVMITPVEEIP